MANSVDPDQIGAVCSGFMLLASILNLSVMLGNYLQQTTSADDIFSCIFFGALRVKTYTVIRLSKDLTWLIIIYMRVGGNRWSGLFTPPPPPEKLQSYRVS